ncbi:hypothetical protein HMPREF1624_03780 [Sporothrix schenckii ATCC 58251]|uniref:Oxidoreductase n=1 Tax=Sporothrix schenckii (strain ATCC 58251 / de Perez 2211183) TaxID=1391915 RepID=U7PXR0_SPOS1|nr:hypothetical protein HMPREF1624_03780 [Sporothrix schenckii ATCC 58251]
MPFPYKTVLVTGATSGIGQALVERLLTHGDSIFVIAAGRRQDRLDALLAAHGPDKIAIENVDVGDLAQLPAWVAKITAAHPTLDCVVLNAGFQQSINLADPASVSLQRLTDEVTVNYLSPVHASNLFLPHFIALGAQGQEGREGPGRPTAIVFVTSGLSIVPIARCPNYCATKAALHSLAWTLRTQLQADPATARTRVIEIVPPAVETELHTRQGLPAMGMPLGQFIDEIWAGLTADEDIDEVMPQLLRNMSGHVEDAKRESYANFAAMMAAQTAKAKEAAKAK